MEFTCPAVDLALDFVVLALYDVVVMCDDSASMKVRSLLLPSYMKVHCSLQLTGM